MKRLLLVPALAAATLLVPAPAHAAEAVPCGDGEIGYIVRDAHGDLVTVCVRDDTEPYRDWVGDVIFDWALGLPVPYCYYYPDSMTVECDDPEYPPMPPTP